MKKDKVENNITINGPINVLRLEGKIDGVSKVIYIYMDIHVDVRKQTQCNDFKSLDLHQYLAKSFEEISSDKPVDLFFETRKSEAILEPHQYKDRYIEQVQELFKREFTYEKQKIKKSERYPNVRFHYLDIRDLLFVNIDSDMDEISSILQDYWVNFNMTNDNIKFIGFLLDNIYKEVSVIKLLLEGGDINKILKKSKFNDNTKKIFISLSKSINKIRKSYYNKKVKEIINKYINDTIIPKIIKLLNINGELFNMIKDNKSILIPKVDKLQKTEYGHLYGPLPIKLRELLTDLLNIYDNKYELFMDINVRLTDLYMLRRFLDKKYINNTIAYTGAGHSCTYIYFLVKYFGFKITHASYNSQKSLKDLHNKINDVDEIINMRQLLFPPKLLQCSDITSFPKNFE